MSDFPSTSNTPSLPYAEPAPRRPGIMTAVGVMSIVVGCLSVLFCLSGIVSGVMYLMMSRGSLMPPMVATPAPIVTSSTTSYSIAVASGSTVVAAPTTTSTTTIPAAFPSFRFNVDPRASMLTIGESVLSLLVAGLLIVAGGLLLRDSRKALRLHRLYIWLKLPLIVLSTVATWWTYSSLMRGMTSLGASLPMNGFPEIMALVQAGLHALFALAYPVALLIILTTRASKVYFKQLADGTVM